MLDDDELAVAAQPTARVDDRPAALATTGCPALPAMSMPLDSPFGKPAMTLPCVGQTQSSLSSSISGTRAESGRAGSVDVGADAGAAGGGAAAAGGALVAGAAIVAGAAATTAAGGGVVLACACICASACSEYGSLTARGSVLNVAVLPRPEGSIGAACDVAGSATWWRR